MAEAQRTQQQVKRERWRLLRQIHDIFDKPLIVLSFIWVLLVIYDFLHGLNRSLTILSYVIWAVFILNFLIEIIVAPEKIRYLRHHWLTAISLLLPALRIFSIFRIFRLLRAAQAVRSISLLRLLTSLNRSLRAVRRTLYRRRLIYVISATLVVIFSGAAGMAYFESPAALYQAGITGAGLPGYTDALWWTAMIMTTMGSDYWPRTAEGRILTFLLALYAFAIFGFITATIASHFVGQDQGKQLHATRSETEMLRAEIASLRTQVALLTRSLESERNGKRERTDRHEPTHQEA